MNLPAPHILYDVYGHQMAPNPSRLLLGFNGQLLMDGLYLLGNGFRAYNPRLMRFLKSDSLSPFAAGGLNSYAYCSGDPVNFSDPSGHMKRVRSPALAGSPKRRHSSLSPERVLEEMYKNPGWENASAPERESSADVLRQMEHRMQLDLDSASERTQFLVPRNLPSKVTMPSSGQKPEKLSRNEWLARLNHITESEAISLKQWNKTANRSLGKLTIEESRQVRDTIIEARRSGHDGVRAVRLPPYGLSKTDAWRANRSLSVNLKNIREKR